ncbi:MAG TPA: agmatine deiminase family protein [Polyangiales bacterium]
MGAAREAGFRQPGEWTLHRACWLAFPSDPALWPALDSVQASFAAMCRAISEGDAQGAGEQLEVLVVDAAAESQARELLSGLSARFHRVRFGDIWMRDIAPVFLVRPDGGLGSVRFRFNGWGGKYTYPGDDRVAGEVQALVEAEHYASSLVLEGGAVESDGAGLCLTTRDVALNPNRNPRMNQAQLEEGLLEALGAERVVWLERGLMNDHTDGHIDNIARFIAPGRALCMRASGADDPNREVLGEIEGALRAAGLSVETLPSPGLVLGRDGQPIPASYLNFYIANRTVVVPVFGSIHDEAALRALEPLFPGRSVRPVQAKVLLEEGGTVHCITQQEPAVVSSPVLSAARGKS